MNIDKEGLFNLLIDNNVPSHHAKTILRRIEYYPNVQLDELLRDFAILPPPVIARVISFATKVELFEEYKYKIDVELSKTEKIYPKNDSAVPIKMTDNEITILVGFPKSKEVGNYLTQINSRFQQHSIKILIANKKIREEIFRQFYNDEEIWAKLRKAIDNAENEIKSDKTDSKNLIILLETILWAAGSVGASDIQFFASDCFGQIQFKIEDTGHIVAEMSVDLYNYMMTKMMALSGSSSDRLKKKTTDEGEINPFQSDVISDEIFKHYNFRCQFGAPENRSKPDYIVGTIRLLAKNITLPSFEQAGFTNEQVETIKDATKCVAGLIMLIGPVDSGKSTTLFSMLSSIDPTRRLVKTIENPIEFRNPFWEQNSLGGYETKDDEKNAYRQQIRGMVRKSPHCLLAGEIRSPEDCEKIVDIAYASTLCFTSMHSENVGNAVGRLKYWEIRDNDISSIVRLIIAQRLVRKLCEKCKIEEDDERKLKEVEHYIGGPIGDLKIYKPSVIGCENCRFTGFSGRCMIAEMLSHRDEYFADAVMNPNHSKIGEALFENKKSLWHSAMNHVVKGIVSVDEVLRHTHRIK